MDSAIKKPGGNAEVLLGGDYEGNRLVIPGGLDLQYLALNNKIKIIDSDAVTLAAANTTKGALATAKFINGFFNPAGSGKLAVLLKAIVSTVSGTPAGGFFFNYLSGLAPITSAVTGTIRNSYLTAADSSVMQALVGVVLGVEGAPTTALKQLMSLGGPAAVAAGAGLYDAREDSGGLIVVPPQAMFGIMGTGAGTTHIVQSTLVWAEIDIPA